MNKREKIINKPKNQSTVSKGDAFENFVANVLEHEINSRALGLDPRACQLYKKRKYFSRDRQADIIVDISIEFTLPGQSKWSILWIFECKDYSSSLPVNDVEEFYSKVQQIAGVNVKAVLVTSGSLQEGALQFARSKGIGVARRSEEHTSELQSH